MSCKGLYCTIIGWYAVYLFKLNFIIIIINLVFFNIAYYVYVGHVSVCLTVLFFIKMNLLYYITIDRNQIKCVVHWDGWVEEVKRNVVTAALTVLAIVVLLNVQISNNFFVWFGGNETHSDQILRLYFSWFLWFLFLILVFRTFEHTFNVPSKLWACARALGSWDERTQENLKRT